MRKLKVLRADFTIKENDAVQLVVRNNSLAELLEGRQLEKGLPILRKNFESAVKSGRVEFQMRIDELTALRRIVSVMGSTFSSDVAMLKKLRKAAADLGANTTFAATTVGIMTSRTKSAGYGRNQTPKTGGPKGHSFGSCKKVRTPRPERPLELDKTLFRIWHLCWNLTPGSFRSRFKYSSTLALLWAHKVRVASTNGYRQSSSTKTPGRL